MEAVSAEQLEQVRNLFREYQAELPPQYRAASLASELSSLPGVYSPPKGKLLLATVAGQPVGCVGLRPFPQEGACEMKRLYVRPTFRGGKVGKLLVERAVHEAWTLGYSRLRLDTHPPTMQAALSLYRKLGFQEVAPDPADRVEGLLYMELRLAPAQTVEAKTRDPGGRSLILHSWVKSTIYFFRHFLATCDHTLVTQSHLPLHIPGSFRAASRSVQTIFLASQQRSDYHAVNPMAISSQDATPS